MLDLNRINLIVSCPNDGGLLHIKSGRQVVIDRLGTTGICYDNNNNFYRAIQHQNISEIVVYPKNKEKFSIIHRDIKDVHDLYYFNNSLFIVSTSTNEVIKLDNKFEIDKRYKFQGDGDAWHLNCLEAINDRLYVSAFCNYEQHYSYKGKTYEKGFLVDVLNGDVLIDKLSQPHTPKLDGGLIYICDSETKALKVYKDKNLVNTIGLDAYTRGLYIDKDYIYVGLSKSRNIEDKNATSKIVILDKKTLRKESEILIDLDEIYNIIPCNKLNIFEKDLIPIYDDKYFSSMKHTLEQLKTELAETKQNLNQKSKELEQSKLDLQAKAQELLQVKNELISIHLSTSWEVTRPLRKFKSWLVK